MELPERFYLLRGSPLLILAKGYPEIACFYLKSSKNAWCFQSAISPLDSIPIILKSASTMVSATPLAPKRVGDSWLEAVDEALMVSCLTLYCDNNLLNIYLLNLLYSIHDKIKIHKFFHHLFHLYSHPSKINFHEKK